jgi:lipopolysaccharide export system permease protein
MFAVTFVVLLMVMAGRFVRILDQAATGQLATDVLFKLISYRMPNLLNLILPLGFYIGILLSHGRLYTESEMVVLSTAGMSPSRLLAYTALMAFGLMGFMGFNSLYLAPTGEAKVQEILADPNTKESLGMIIPGDFRTFNGDRQTAYVEELTEDKSRMKTLFLSSVREHKGRRTQALVVAETGEIITDKASGYRYLELYNGFQYDGAPGRLDFQVAEFERYGVRLVDRRSALERSEEREAVPSMALLRSDDLGYQATLQWRLSLPLIIPVITLVALALSRTNPRTGRYAKLFPAILVYMVYLVSLHGARNSIEGGTLPPSIGVWPVHVAFFIFGMLLFYGDNWWFRLRPRSRKRPDAPTGGGAR